jgi:4-carboxymuconolactone decarboxylase
VSRIAQFARLAARPGCGTEVQTALREAKTAAEAEPGTEVFAIHTEPGNPEVVWVYELYLDSDAQAAHSGSAATARLRETLADRLLEPLSVLRGALEDDFGLPAGGPPDPNPKEELTVGQATIEGERRARLLFGDERYERTRADEPATARRDLLRLADEVVFGRVYSRAGLSRRQRSLCTIACLTALREPVQLHAHIAGALNIGVTAREVVEVITQVAMYAGFPAALNAMAVADECFAAAATESGA